MMPMPPVPAAPPIVTARAFIRPGMLVALFVSALLAFIGVVAVVALLMISTEVIDDNGVPIRAMTTDAFNLLLIVGVGSCILLLIVFIIALLVYNSPRMLYQQ